LYPVDERGLLADAAADADIEGLDHLTVFAGAHPLKTDIRGHRLPAVGGTAGVVHLDCADVVGQLDVRIEPAQHAGHPTLRLGQRDRTELGAGTGHRAALEGTRLGGVLLEQRFGEQILEILVGNVDDNGVLAAGQANLAGAVLVGVVGQFDGVLGREPADGNAQADVVPAVRLVADADVVVLAVLDRATGVVGVFLAEVLARAAHLEVDVLRLERLADLFHPQSSAKNRARFFDRFWRLP